MNIEMKVLFAIGLLICPLSQSLGADPAVIDRPTRYALSEVTISLDEPTCAFVPCPSYTVSIHGDGRVVYEGRKNVANLGQREATIEPQSVLELLNHIYSVGFFSMSNDYIYSHPSVSIFRGEVVETRNITTDTSATAISVSIRNYQKRIAWLTLNPEELLTIRSRIKEVSGVERWVN